MFYLENLAQKPHPMGSLEHDRVRDYLFAELAKMGVSPEVQRTTGVTPRYQVAGSVENIVARLKGSSGATDALMLAAHYDSVPAGPGAADDGAGVASLLETLRALRSGPLLKNDVIFLLTDGEEDGLLGASAFMAEHPSARDVRVALNFEARGNAGVSQMFETSAQNGRLVQILAESTPHPRGSSLSYEIYKYMPNDTDMTVFKNFGVAGLNFAFIGHWEAYHTPLDNPPQLDRGSLQQHGNYALSLTRSLGKADLAQLRAPDAVYFAVPGGWFVNYSRARMWHFLIAGVLLFIGMALYASGAEQLGARALLFGFLANLGLIIVVVAAGYGFARGITWLHLHRLPDGDFAQSAPYMLSFVALLFALWIALRRLLRKKLSSPSLILGAALIFFLLAAASAKWLSGGSYLFVWPLFAMFPGLIFASSDEDFPSALAVLGLCAFSLPAIVIFVPLVTGSYEAFGLTSIGAPGLAATLALFFMALAPALNVARAVVPVVALVVALFFFADGANITHYSAQHPKPSMVAYALDADTGKALWASSAARVDDWTAQFVGSQPSRGRLQGFFPDWFTFAFLQHEAVPLPLQPPDAKMLENSAASGTRTLRLKITSPRHARSLSMDAPENEILEASVNGKKLGQPSEARFSWLIAVGALTAIGKHLEQSSAPQSNPVGKWLLDYVNVPPEGIDLSLTVRGAGPLKLRISDRSLGLPEIPGKAFPSRPADAMPRHAGDQTMVRRNFVF